MQLQLSLDVSTDGANGVTRQQHDVSILSSSSMGLVARCSMHAAGCSAYSHRAAGQWSPDATPTSHNTR